MNASGHGAGVGEVVMGQGRTGRTETPGATGMRGSFLRLATAALLLALGLAVGMPGASGQGTGPVVKLHLDGVVDPLLADYLEEGIAKAGDDGARAVLLQIDTPGGLASSMRQITQAVLNAPMPVICFVSPQGARAASAGAFVLMSCPIAAMAPGTNVGAATPVGIQSAVGSEKVTNDAAASIRALAEQHGRNAEVAETFVTEAASISAEEALAENVIDLIADDDRALLDEVDGREVLLADGTSVALTTSGASIEDQEMGGLTGLLHDLFDPNLAFIFFWLGIALVVLELLVPGHVFAGTLGTILLIIAIISFGFLPVQLIGIALLVLAAVLMIIEAFSPGFGVWGVTGLVCLVLGGWFLYDRAGGVSVSPLVIAPVALGAAVFFFFVTAKVMAMRHLPPAQDPGDLVGRTGVALASGLDPEGVVRVSAEEWKAVTRGRRIPAGDEIRVTQVEGLVLTVEPAAATDVETETAGPETMERPDDPGRDDQEKENA